MNAVIATQLQAIAQIVAPITKAKSLIVVGSWARGDARWHEAAGDLILESDLDLYALSDIAWTQARVSAIQPELQRLVQEPMWAVCGVDASCLAIDLHLVNLSNLRRSPVTVRFFDLKYDSQVVWGEDVRPVWPAWQSRDLPPYEGLRLLFNRPYYMAGSISDAALSDVRWLEAQALKNYRACALALSLLKGEYRSRPAEAAQQLSPADLSAAIQRGLSSPGASLADWRRSLDMVEQTMNVTLRHLTGAADEDSAWRKLPRVYLQSYIQAAIRMRWGGTLPDRLIDLGARALRVWRGMKWQRRFPVARLMFDDPIFGIYRSLWEACRAVEPDGAIDPAGIQRARLALQPVLHVDPAPVSWDGLIDLAVRACDSYYNAAWLTHGPYGTVRLRSID